MWSYTRTYYIFGSGDCLQLFLLRNVFLAILTFKVPIGGDSEIDLWFFEHNLMKSLWAPFRCNPCVAAWHTDLHQQNPRVVGVGMPYTLKQLHRLLIINSWKHEFRQVMALRMWIHRVGLTIDWHTIVQDQAQPILVDHFQRPSEDLGTQICSYPNAKFNTQLQ